MQLCYKYKTINPTILIIFDEVQNSLTWQERTKRGREGEKRRKEKKREEKRRKEKKREEKKRKEKEIVFYLQKSFKKTFFSWKGRQRHSDTKRIEMACDKRTFDEVLADSYITIYSIVKWQPMSE